MADLITLENRLHYLEGRLLQLEGLTSANLLRSVALYAADVVWTNMPAAETHFLGSVHRVSLDLTQTNEIRLTMTLGVIGHTTSVIRMAYWDGISSYITFGDDLPLTAGGDSSTAWVDMPEAAKTTDTILAVLGAGGNAVADPQFRWVGFEIR